MTTNETTIPEHDAPLAGADEAVELDLEGLDFDLDPEGAASAEEPAPTPTPEPTPPPVAAVPPAPAPVSAPESKVGRPEKRGGDLSRALKESRARERYYKNIVRDLKPDRRIPPPVVPTLRAPQIPEERIAAIRKDAERATDLGAPAEAVLREVDARIKTLYSDLGPAIAMTYHQMKAADQERAFARKHPDYYDKVQRSGLPQLVGIDPATGRPMPGFNQKVADEIYNAENPTEAAYEIARALLGEIKDESDEIDVPSPAPQPVAQVPQSTPPPTPAAPAEVVEAERRGARQVAERVATNLQRPRGVRGLPSAGEPPKQVLDEGFRKQLDSLMDSDFPKFDAFMKKNPQVDEWYMQRGRFAPSTRR